MDARVLTGFVGPVLLIALLVNVVRWVAARPLDGLAGSARARSTLTSLVGALVVVGLVTGAWLDEAGVWFAAAPAIAAAAGVVVAAAGERLLPRPSSTQDTVRVASLRIRRGTEHVGLHRYCAAGLLLSGVALVIGWLTSGPDGRTGMRSWGAVAVTAGPYPGRAYAGPVLLALGLLVLLTWLALRVVDQRPALGPDEADLDRALRLGSRIRVLRWAAGGALLTGAGLAITIGTTMNELTQRLRGVASGGPRPPWDWAQNGGFALTGLGVVALLAALVAVLWDTPAVPRSAREAGVGLDGRDSANSRPKGVDA